MKPKLFGLKPLFLITGIVFIAFIMVLNLKPVSAVSAAIEKNNRFRNSEKVVDLKLRELSPLGSYMEISSRSIFNASRKPITLRESGRASSEKSEALAFPDLSLIGVIVSSGEQVAVLKSANTENAIRLRVGLEIEKWVVQKIDKTTITFHRGDEMRRVSFKKNGEPGEFISYESK